MSFANTLDSLFRNLNIPTNPEIDTRINNRLAKSIESVTQLTPSNNAVTINPNLSVSFKLTLSSSTTISFSSLDDIYSINGSTFSLYLQLQSDDISISWPNNVIWQDEIAPFIGYKNIITFTTFDEGTTWYGTCYTVKFEIPSN